MNYDQEDLNMMLRLLLDHIKFSLQALCGTELEASVLEIVPKSGQSLTAQDIAGLARQLTRIHERVLNLFRNGVPVGSKLPSFYEHIIQEQNLIVAILDNNENIYEKIAQYLLYHNAQIYLLNEKHIDPFQELLYEDYSKLLKQKANRLISEADAGVDLAMTVYESEQFKNDSIQLLQDIQSGRVLANIKPDEAEHELMENRLFLSLILKNEPEAN